MWRERVVIEIQGQRNTWKKTRSQETVWYSSEKNPHHLKCKLLLPFISCTACTMVPRYHLYPPKPILQTGDDVHLCPQPPVASELTGNKSSLWSLLETRAFLGCHSLDGSYDPATLASAILEPSSPFLSAPGPCLYPNVPVERIHLHERTLLMNCPLAAAVSSRKDVFRSLPSTLHCDAISLRQEPC